MYSVLLRWWRLLLTIISPVCCSWELLVQALWHTGSQGEGHALLWHKKGFTTTLALLLLTFLLTFSTVRATRAILFPFLIALVRLHLVCARSFWCNPTTVYAGSSRDWCTPQSAEVLTGCTFSVLACQAYLVNLLLNNIISVFFHLSTSCQLNRHFKSFQRIQW